MGQAPACTCPANKASRIGRQNRAVNLESLQGRLIFGKTTRIRPLEPGPHAGAYCTTAHRLQVAEGAELEGWSAKPADGRVDGTVLYFGGRNENVAWAPDMASFAPHQAIYAFNYRGFGQSTGRASERRAKADAQAIHDFVAGREATTHLTLIGRSLGTGIALWLARETAPRRLVLMSPFESVHHVMRTRRFGWLAAPLMTQRFDCTDLAASHAGRTLVLLADNDRSVPHDRSHRLCARLPNAPQLQLVAGTTHQSLPRSAGAQRAIAQFLAAPDDATCRRP